MDDIVERLRNAAVMRSELGERYVERAAGLKREAADLIESLRSDNARLAKELEEALEAAAESITSESGAAAYCQSLRQFEQVPCLGWEWKAKNGEFGKLEHDAHRKANELMGRHQGLARAAQICRAAAIRHKATVTTDDLPEGGSET